MFRDILEKILNRQSIDSTEQQAAFAAMLDGTLTEIETAAFLTALRAKGEDAKDLAAGAMSLRTRASKVEISSLTRPLADNCGTGGDGSGSFNISTSAAIIAASLGVRIAKHGNRSISSKCGSADLLFTAGYPEHMTPQQTAALLDQTNFTFFFAPNFHPAMKHVGPVRRGLGIRTIFNLLGPLANPIGPDVQMIGVGAKAYLRPMAEAAATIGIGTALIVHSRDGMDEISPQAVTDAILAKNGRIEELTIDPKSLGISGAHDLSGGDAAMNVSILRNLLSGQEGPCNAAVALNCGALLWITGHAKNLAEGFSVAHAHIKSGKAEPWFSNWIQCAQALAGGSP